jgi:hypothetical protein
MKNMARGVLALALIGCSSGGSGGGVPVDAGTDSGASGGAGGFAGAGGYSGTGAVGGGSGGFGAGGTAGSGGVGGGAAGTGGQPALAECSNRDVNCVGNSDCCPGAPAGGGCVYTGFGTTCYPHCTQNDQCVSGCCKGGYCSGQLLVGGQVATVCDGTTCGYPGAGCDTTDCCAGSLCVDIMKKGYGLCAAICNTDADCEGGCCMQVTSGQSVCAPQVYCP